MKASWQLEGVGLMVAIMMTMIACAPTITTRPTRYACPDGF